MNPLPPAVFVGAFLLFQVQPLFARFLLPWFGGNAGVWTVCMLFFQVLLVAGYGYAHAITRLLGPRAQAVLHVALLAVALLALPIVPAASLKPGPAGDPTWQILSILVVCLGVPYFVLSATGPLLQAWSVRLHPESAPYRLYALSNTGSLLALVSYPFVAEPLLSRQTQANVWAWGLGTFVVLCAMTAWQLWRHADRIPGVRPAVSDGAPAGRAEGSGHGDDARGERPTLVTRALWFGLPACGSVLLLASTNTLCQEVASFPFLWVLPLALYLLTFILCFDHPGWYRRKTFGLLLVPVLALVCYALFKAGNIGLPVQIVVYGGMLFVACMVCHGEAYRLKPPASSLTLFYLFIAAGGAAGGVFVAAVAPRVFRSFVELGWGLVLLTLLLFVIHVRERSVLDVGGRRWPQWPMVLGGAVALVVTLSVEARNEAHGAVLRTRNFYGALKVIEMEPEKPLFHAFQLQNGQIIHGLQFLVPSKALLPTAYYGELSGVGLTLNQLARQANRRVGVVGLGVGTLAAYGRTDDTFRFYEIDPEVERLARTGFTYLGNCKARVEVVLGDARMSLEREPSQRFDLLVLDAFSGDAIPVHLLTQEAFVTYLRHLKSDGIIAVHISNRHLDLYPVLRGAAEQFGLGVAEISDRVPASLWWYMESRWVLLARNRAFLSEGPIATAAVPPAAGAPGPVLWTDDHSSLFSVTRHR